MAQSDGPLSIPPASSPPPAPDNGQTIKSPNWTKLPSAEEFMRFYPERAQRMSIEGRAVIECTVAVDLTLRDCVIQSETPPDQGFGDAALNLATLFKMKSLTRDGQPTVGGRITIPIRFRMSTDRTGPAPPPANTVSAP